MAPGGGAKNKRALARPTCVSKPFTKFDWILSSGLGGDNITVRRTDGQTDGGDNNIPDAFSKKRGDNNLFIFRIDPFPGRVCGKERKQTNLRICSGSVTFTITDAIYFLYREEVQINRKILSQNI